MIIGLLVGGGLYLYQGVTRMKLTVPILILFIKWQRSIAQLYHRYIDTQYMESMCIETGTF